MYTFAARLVTRLALGSADSIRLALGSADSIYTQDASNLSTLIYIDLRCVRRLPQ